MAKQPQAARPVAKPAPIQTKPAASTPEPSPVVEPEAAAPPTPQPPPPAPEPPPEPKLQAGPPAARRHPSQAEQLHALSGPALMVEEFAEVCGLSDNARAYLDLLVANGWVQRDWVHSAARYSLTEAGQQELSKS